MTESSLTQKQEKPFRAQIKIVIQTGLNRVGEGQSIGSVQAIAINAINGAIKTKPALVAGPERRFPLMSQNSPPDAAGKEKTMKRFKMWSIPIIMWAIYIAAVFALASLMGLMEGL